MDLLAGRHRGLDSVQETDEFLVAVARHATADYRAVKDKIWSQIRFDSCRDTREAYVYVRISCSIAPRADVGNMLWWRGRALSAGRTPLLSTMTLAGRMMVKSVPASSGCSRQLRRHGRRGVGDRGVA